MRFKFATATRIIFGPGTIGEVAALSAEMGKSAFILTGSTTRRAETLLGQLEQQGIEHVEFNVAGEPTTTLAKKAVELARRISCDMVISIGGGSVLDTGKVVGAMLTNSGELEDYLEVVGDGKPLVKNCAPHIAIPTTAGTGAEVTRNAVLSVPEHKVKVSMRSPLMLPSLAVVDPKLTYSMSPSVTASTGLDALTQLIEVYVSKKANPLTDGICREGLTCAGRSLQRAYENGDDHDGRKDMAIASLFGGLGLANAKLGAVHGFAGPLGGMFHAPHGVICARLLPFVMETNVRGLLDREADSPSISRFDDIAQILTGNVSAKASDGVTWIQELCAKLSVPSLKEFGLTEADFPVAVEKAQRASSMKGNPIELTAAELLDILQKAFKS